MSAPTWADVQAAPPGLPHRLAHARWTRGNTRHRTAVDRASTAHTHALAAAVATATALPVWVATAHRNRLELDNRRTA